MIIKLEDYEAVKIFYILRNYIKSNAHSELEYQIIQKVEKQVNHLLQGKCSEEQSA